MTATAVPSARAAPARRLPRRARSGLRTGHVVLAAGWTGLSLVMLVLPASVLVQGAGAGFAVPAMALVGNGIIPFFAVGTVLTGAALGIGTPWGLVRYRWVVAKTVLALTVIVGSVVLNTGWIEAAATGDDRSLLWSLVLSSAVHQVMLLTATVLSVEKPWGRWRRA
ncbi:hypothetical protein AD006_06750 [Pseudonocardia sp. EC080610-09]|uniref:hypothetical protein n=1 Tax=unclassified Pseudonocardia TaxID=2619320 RepID=UPI0006CB6E82|nr:MULTISPECIES: hypothetical protein [unclassified Pseudonocardia]ALE75693.1 hypothetical protein FRP1_27570 [Pseudonocardia sp. EC080625-04]ALL75075.1 hypothetical protein AD006_06750 [Pseudonocardia sp. EC080610-09]ALL82097.1 hypothetical protein AD017_14565 [Pseudonocardia sp. EC080619-01]